MYAYLERVMQIKGGRDQKKRQQEKRKNSKKANKDTLLQEEVGSILAPAPCALLSPCLSRKRLCPSLRRDIYQKSSLCIHLVCISTQDHKDPAPHHKHMLVQRWRSSIYVVESGKCTSDQVLESLYEVK